MVVKGVARATLPHTALKSELKRQLQEKLKQAAGLAFVYQEDLALEVEAEIADLDPIAYVEVEEELNLLKERLSEQEKAIKAQRKWLEQNLPTLPLQACPEAVTFLVESGLIYSIVLFNHEIQIDERGAPLIKMNGDWASWEEVANRVVFDSSSSCIQSKDNPYQRWNYISPKGLVAKDPFSQNLYRIEKLDQAVLQEVQLRATQFWKTHPEVDVGQVKPCVLQLVSTTKEYLPKRWLTNQINDYYPQHSTLRLIDSNGNVYSFGMQVTNKFEVYLMDHPKDWLATGYAQIRQPDFEETRLFDERYVTSIPITKERFSDIVTFVNTINSNPGMRFSALNQNCNTFAVAVAHVGGINIDAKMSAPELVGNLFPRVQDLPILGRIIGCVKAIVSYTPAPIARVFKVLTGTLLYLPRKVITFVFTLIFLRFGADKEVEPEKGVDNRQYQPLNRFSRLITSFADRFNEEKLMLYHSFKLVEWQKRHSFATKVFRYEGRPTFCM